MPPVRGERSISQDVLKPMISITITPTAMAISVPAGPATGKNVVPGITKAPQPTMQPKAIAQTSTGERYRSSPFLLFCCSNLPVHLPRYKTDFHGISVCNQALEGFKESLRFHRL